MINYWVSLVFIVCVILISLHGLFFKQPTGEFNGNDAERIGFRLGQIFTLCLLVNLLYFIIVKGE